MIDARSHRRGVAAVIALVVVAGAGLVLATLGANVPQTMRVAPMAAMSARALYAADAGLAVGAAAAGEGVDPTPPDGLFDAPTPSVSVADQGGGVFEVTTEAAIGTSSRRVVSVLRTPGGTAFDVDRWSELTPSP